MRPQDGDARGGASLAGGTYRVETIARPAYPAGADLTAFPSR
ncbi:hypothetical protein [Pandoraea sp. ISTKB]|nr:hypothetical protein [Pandoraea sp. ISTKB]